MSHRLQDQRYELKYHLSESKALRVREFVRAHLTIDEYSARHADWSYPTLSLYLDSDSLDTYWHVINGDKNRFKLRLRYYDVLPDSPVFFEIKRREGDVMLKQRAGVRRGAVRGLVGGQLPRQEDLLNPRDARAFGALNRFCRLMHELSASPKLHVAYVREAYENPDHNDVRVTFDRRVESQPHHHDDLVARSPRPHSVFGRTVILELKFTTRYPGWFRDLVEMFDCVQEGAAKYSTGILDNGEDWVMRPDSPERVLEEFLTAMRYPGVFEAARH
jgi:SPX domain protein involved in polyphosphate accumulation